METEQNDKLKLFSPKQLARYERKKKKMAAYLNVLELNLNDNIRNRFDISEEANKIFEPEVKRIKSSDMDQQKVQILQKDNMTELDEYKLRLKERQKRYRQIPKFRLKLAGEKAKLDLDEKERIPLFLSDIQHLLMYAQLGHHSPYSPNRWCMLEKYNHLSQTVVVLVENLSLYHYLSYESDFEFLKKTIENKCEVITPVAFKNNIIEDLVLVPLTGTQKQKLVKQFGSLDSALQLTGDVYRTLRIIFPISLNVENQTDIKLPDTDKFSRTSLLLSSAQMVEENYPVLLRGELSHRYADYVLTKDKYTEVTPFSPMFGLDCEMCRTTTGQLELTRISLVNERLENVYEKLVKPDNQITDYLTRYSGITPKMLADVTTKLTDVQNDLRELLPSDAILVGQSLNFDLHTLKMMHPYVIDTSIIFNLSGDRTKKTKLQILANEFLKEKIQQNVKKGHCSIEDSTTSIKLAQLKLSKNLEFGDAVLLGKRSFAKNYSDLEMKASVKDATNSKTDWATNLFKHLTADGEKNALIVGCSNVIGDYINYVSKSKQYDRNKIGKKRRKQYEADNVRLAEKLVCEKVDCNDDVANLIANISQRYSFTLGHIQMADDELNPTEDSKMFRKIDLWLKKIWDNMALHSLFVVVFTGQHNGSSGASFVQLKRHLNCVNNSAVNKINKVDNTTN